MTLRVSDKCIDRLVRAIRRGKVRNGREAAAALGKKPDGTGYSESHVWAVLRCSREAGHRIATRTGGKWELIGEAK